MQGFQYFSSVPVLHYLQEVLFFIKIWTFFMNILCNTLWNKEVPITILSWLKYLLPPHIERPVYDILQTKVLYCNWSLLFSEMIYIQVQRNLS